MPAVLNVAVVSTALGLAKVVVPGPLGRGPGGGHVRGGFAVVGDGGIQGGTLGQGDALVDAGVDHRRRVAGAATTGAGGVLMWSRGAPAARPSKARAVRWPVPVMIRARALPGAQPVRFDDLLHDGGQVGGALVGAGLADDGPGGGVPGGGGVGAGAGGHLGGRGVGGRVVGGLAVDGQGGGLGLGLVGFELDVGLGDGGALGDGEDGERRPTSWLLPSLTSSRSVLEPGKLPVADSSASSEPRVMRCSRVPDPGGGGEATVICTVSLPVRSVSLALSWRM